MPDRTLFDGADVTGITWGPATSGDQHTDISLLRNCAAGGGTASAGLLRSAADEIETLRAELIALKKAIATLSRKNAALQRIADGIGLDVTVKEERS